MGDFDKGSKPDPSMKLLATLVVAAFGQDYDFYSSGEADRFGSVGDFSHTQSDTSSPALSYQADGSVVPIGTNADSQASHLQESPPAPSVGGFADSVRYLRYGHAGNRRFCHTTRNNRAVYNWTSHAYGGYFAEGRNFMECMGEELYCFIEERAHYGQIIGITAGCEQMMNHPSVTIQDQQALISSSYTQINAIKNNYNQEAARGGANRHGFFTYYGLGGCLAMPAQNGHHLINDRARPNARGGTWPDASGLQTNELRHPEYHRQGVDSSSWRSYKWLNYYRNFHGGYGQNQCLRFPKQRLNDDAPVQYQLEPFALQVLVTLSAKLESIHRTFTIHLEIFCHLALVFAELAVSPNFPKMPPSENLLEVHNRIAMTQKFTKQALCCVTIRQTTIRMSRLLLIINSRSLFPVLICQVQHIMHSRHQMKMEAK